MTWTCPICNRDFTKRNQSHSCNERTLDDFLKGKSPHTVELFRHFIKEYQLIGKVSVHPNKSMITISGKTGLAYVTQLGKNFIDIVFPFKEPYEDNLCFVKIKQVPGSDQYNHYFRMCFNEDINEEMIRYMKLAFKNGN